MEDSAGKHGGAPADLLEQILSRDNRLLAWPRGQANQGAAGMDGMTIQAFPALARQPWERIRSALDAGPDRPAAGRRGMIPNASGGERPLGIPPGLDRGMQHAIAQGLGPLFAPHFSTYRAGLRPGRRARMALAEREEAHRDGRRYGVDCDLKSFFDTVTHSLLMNRLAKRMSDRRGLRLLGRYLRAGVILPEGRREPTSCGMPPGGPLSPVLAKVRLDALDQEWERRGLRVARDADAFLLVVRSQRAAQRGLHRSSRCIEGHLRRRVNPHTRQAARRSAGSFLGFELRRAKVHWTDAAVKRFKERGREMTDRSNGRHMTARIEALTREVSGGLNDFGHSQSYAAMVEVDQWLRRRVRLCSWQQWPRPRTRRRHLLALGITRDEVKLATRSRQGHWRMAGNRIVPRALNTPWLWQQGVPHRRPQWMALHDGASAP